MNVSSNRLAVVNTGLLVMLLLLTLGLTAQFGMVPPHEWLFSTGQPRIGTSDASMSEHIVQATSGHLNTVLQQVQASSGRTDAVLKQMQASSEHVDTVLKQMQASSDQMGKTLQQRDAVLQQGLAAVQLAATAATTDTAGPNTNKFNGTFTYTCEPPCGLDEGFFNRGVEFQIKQVFLHHLQHQPARIIDAGMNTGYFTMLSAAHGAEVMAFDPQPACIAYMQKALSKPANAHLRPQLKMFNAGVGDLGKIHSNPDSCNGFFQGDGEERAGIDVPVLPVRSFWTADDASSFVDLVKIDTEGAEVPILEGLLPFAKKKLLGGIIVEVSPPNWKKRGADEARGVAILRALNETATEVYMLEDGTPWDFPLTKADGRLSYIKGKMFAGIDMAALAADRIRKVAGCNIYFRFGDK